jgi:hypothetical protein
MTDFIERTVALLFASMDWLVNILSIGKITSSIKLYIIYRISIINSEENHPAKIKSTAKTPKILLNTKAEFFFLCKSFSIHKGMTAPTIPIIEDTYPKFSIANPNDSIYGVRINPIPSSIIKKSPIAPKRSRRILCCITYPKDFFRCCQKALLRNTSPSSSYHFFPSGEKRRNKAETIVPIP